MGWIISPSPRGWAESGPAQNGWAKSGPIFLKKKTRKIQKYFLEFYNFPMYFVCHFD
jgi:hypothetical protein